MAKVGDINLKDSELIRVAREQAEKNRKAAEESNFMLQKLLDTNRVPQTNDLWNTKVVEGNPGRFANPNLPTTTRGTVYNEMDEHSKQLIAAEQGSALQKALITAPYHMIKHLMEQGYTPGQPHENINQIKNSTNVGLALLMAGGKAEPGELGAFRGGMGTRGRKSGFSPEMQSTIDRLANKHTNKDLSQKEVIDEFTRNHPDYKGSDSSIIRQMYRAKTKDDIIPGMAGELKPPVEAPVVGEDLRKYIPQESMNWLQKQKPVDPEWVKQWANEAGVPYSGKIAPQGTNYLSLHPNPPVYHGAIKVRFPPDEHVGRPLGRGEIGKLFDTGLSPGDNFPTLGAKHEPNLMNESGGHYGSAENLEKALELATGHSRTSGGTPGGFNLVSNDYAPRFKLEKGPSEVPSPKPDPNQLKLLSNQTDPTTQAIINMLMAKQYQPSE